MTVLNVSGGGVSYGAGRPALDRVNLRVEAGETVAVLGANGSGKSTLVRAALGLVPLASGRVELFGKPLHRFRDWKQIGYVPQRLGAGSGVPATVRELVSSGRLARRGLFRPSHAGDTRAVTEAIAAVGLAERADEPVSSLSGGQQQRTLIARALAGEPELLVLDEPTAGVDAASQRSFAAALRGFADGGGTVVLVAHELGPLEPLISRAVVLHHGELVHDGAVPEPAGHHARPGHDHVHPHPPATDGSRWTPRGETAWTGDS
ncbi:MAG: metal ABC transporter ATP-binding protein [Micromonosporaceae bacterium]